ncbi:MAG: MFS transporter [Actinobacteria bacterium]|nr:MAG: MFS transporter [Actinomycetota bacterium]
MSGAMRSFQHRNYRLFFMSSIVSNIGTWVQRVAQDWLVLELTHSGTALGIVTGLQFLPSLFFSLLGGSFADRFDKRTLLALTNAGGGIAALTLGTLVLMGNVKIWQVYLLAFGLGVASALDGPVRQAFAIELVGSDDLQNAVSLNSANFNGGRLIGPALSGLMINAFGTGPSFILNGISFLVVISSLFMMDPAQLHRKKRDLDLSVRIRDGFTYLRKRRDLLEIVIVISAMATFGLNFQITTALMAKEEFHRGAGSFGFLGTCIAVGSLSGSILATRRERKPGGQRVMYGALLFGLASIVAALMPTYETFALALPICGGLAITTMIAANTTVQMGADPHIRGRVMGIYLMVLIGGAPFGSPLVGWLAEAVGTRFTIALGGGITCLAALIVLLIGKRSEASDLK